MSFTLTTDEIKLIKSGSVDFTKFTDPGNIDHMYCTFTAQNVLDQNFTTDEAKIIIDSLISKGVLKNNILFNVIENGSNYTVEISQTNPNINLSIATENDTHFKTCVNSLAKIDNKWMFVLTSNYISYVANQS